MLSAGSSPILRHLTSLFWHITLNERLMQKLPYYQVKCEQYWPSNVQGTVTLNGGLSVLLQEVIPFADYELRKLIISNVRHKGTFMLSMLRTHTNI